MITVHNVLCIKMEGKICYSYQIKVIYNKHVMRIIFSGCTCGPCSLKLGLNAIFIQFLSACSINF